MIPCPAEPIARRRIQLPRSSSRAAKTDAYVKVVDRIRPEAWGAVSFEGKIYAPGQIVDTHSLPLPCVLVECAGPVGTWQRGKRREFLYVLWRLDSIAWEWVEIARAQAFDWSWTVAFRELAFRALHPRPELVDITGRSLDAAEEILRMIEQRLVGEITEVRVSALHSVYERVAGRLADSGG